MLFLYSEIRWGSHRTEWFSLYYFLLDENHFHSRGEANNHCGNETFSCGLDANFYQPFSSESLTMDWFCFLRNRTFLLVYLCFMSKWRWTYTYHVFLPFSPKLYISTELCGHRNCDDFLFVRLLQAKYCKSPPLLFSLPSYRKRDREYRVTKVTISDI